MSTLVLLIPQVELSKVVPQQSVSMLAGYLASLSRVMWEEPSEVYIFEIMVSQNMVRSNLWVISMLLENAP